MNNTANTTEELLKRLIDLEKKIEDEMSEIDDLKKELSKYE